MGKGNKHTSGSRRKDTKWRCEALLIKERIGKKQTAKLERLKRSLAKSWLDKS